MTNLLKTCALYLFFSLTANTLYAQDYHKIANYFFQDPKTNHIDFLKKVFQENNAEYLIIDYQKLEKEHEDDVINTDKEIKDLENTFLSNYTQPEDEYDCKEFKYYENELLKLDKRISTLKSLTKMSQVAYELCLSNCDDEYQNYNNQINNYNNAVKEWHEIEGNYDYYLESCSEINETFDDVVDYYKNKLDNIIAAEETRINTRNNKLNSYEKQIQELILSTPFYDIVYYDNGNKNKEGYIDLRTNKFVGEFKKYYNNGGIEIEGFLKDGDFDGHYTEYYENGNKKLEAEYENGKIVPGSSINYNEEGVDVQAETLKKMQEIWDKESAIINKYHESIDNKSVEESIAANPIRTINENGKEIVIDFSKASDATINFFLVRYDDEYSKELRDDYIRDYQGTDGGKISCIHFDDEGNIRLKILYEGEKVLLEEYYDDGRVMKGTIYNRSKVGIWKVYNAKGKVIKEIDMDEKNKNNPFYNY